MQPRFLEGISLRGGTIYTFGTHPRSVEIVFQQSDRMNDVAGLVDRIAERDSAAMQLAQGYFGQPSDVRRAESDGRRAESDAAERAMEHEFAKIFHSHPFNLVEMDRKLALHSQVR